MALTQASPASIPSAALPSSRNRRLVSLDIVRGLTITWITVFHFYADTRGVPGADAGFAALLDRVASGDALGACMVAARALAGIPGLRLDLLLFLTGIVLSLGRPSTAAALFRRRARGILPNYWCGTMAALLVIAALALLRHLAIGGGFLAQLHGGTVIAGSAYRVEWMDAVRSLSVVGRLQDARTLQVLAPSLWYVLLVAQFYLVFPALRAMLLRLGPWAFVAICAGITWAARAAVFMDAPFPGFDANQTVVSFIPFRLIAPALGMAVASLFVHERPCARRRRREVSRSGPDSPLQHGQNMDPAWPSVVVRTAGVILAAPAALVLLASATWLSAEANTPGTRMGVLGPALPLLVGLPGVGVLVWLVMRAEPLARLLAWTGRHSLQLLVVQDLLRFVTGTCVVLLAPLPDLTWPVMPLYLVLALLLTRAWTPVPEWVADAFLSRVGRRSRLAIAHAGAPCARPRLTRGSRLPA